MDSFKLDRSSFNGQTLNVAVKHGEFYKKFSWQERLKVAAHLNSVAYNYDINNPPKIDRTKFSTKSFKS